MGPQKEVRGRREGPSEGGEGEEGGALRRRRAGSSEMQMDREEHNSEGGGGGGPGEDEDSPEVQSILIGNDVDDACALRPCRRPATSTRACSRSAWSSEHSEMQR